jgi:hypothetical protein
MKLVTLIAAGVVAMALTPAARAASLCEQLSQAIGLAKTGFGPVEGDPLSSAPDNHYWRSTIQLSAGDNCSVEAHKVLTCSWRPSTADDLTKMAASVGACFHKAKRAAIPSEDDISPPGVSFGFEAATIEIGLTADVMSLNVEPLNLTPPEDAPTSDPAAASDTSPPAAPADPAQTPTDTAQTPPPAPTTP